MRWDNPCGGSALAFKLNIRIKCNELTLFAPFLDVYGLCERKCAHKDHVQSSPIYIRSLTQRALVLNPAAR